MPGEGISAHVDTHSAFEEGLFSLSLGGWIVMDFRRPPVASSEEGGNCEEIDENHAEVYDRRFRKKLDEVCNGYFARYFFRSSLHFYHICRIW